LLLLLLLVLLVGDGQLHVEVGEGELYELVVVGHERVEDAVDVRLIDVRVVGRREDALPSLVSAVLITDAGPVTAADSTSPAEHDTFARYTRTDGRIYTRRIIFTASLRQLRNIRSTEYRATDASLSTQTFSTDIYTILLLLL